MMKTLYLLVKEESLQIMDGNDTEWKSAFPQKIPYGMPLVHTLYETEGTSDNRFLAIKEFKKVCPQYILRRNVYACIPDDYSAIEKKALEDFIYLSCRSWRVTLFSYSMCVGIQTDLMDYIAVTASKRYITLCRYDQGAIAEREYILWKGEEQIIQFLQKWDKLPIYVCDPNLLLEGQKWLHAKNITVTEDIFEKVAKKLK